MGIEKTHGRNYDLARVLGAIDRGEIVLPEFQRDFVWDTTAVKQLIATCLTGWPIGSLLLLPGKSQIFFRVRAFESAPPVQDPFQLVVLDGQQRLTSLYQALYGRGAFRYGIKFSLLHSDQSIEELEDVIVSLPSEKWERLYGDAKAEYQGGVIPVSALRQASDFYDWRDTALEQEPDSARQTLTKLYVSMLSGLDRYEVPAVVIDDDVHPEAVARIFERVNRLGQALDTFDLMVAKSFTEDFNLRDEWERTQAQFPRLSEFLNGDGLPILTIIALQVRNSLRQQDVLRLSGSSVRDYWHRAAMGLDQGIRFMQQELGVWQADWVPYRSQLPVIACLAMNDALFSNQSAVRQWFWRSIFRGRYNVAANTRAVEDFGALLKGRSEPTGEIVLDKEVLLNANRRQYGALHRGLVCLLATQEPLDPFQQSRNVTEILEDGEDSPVAVSLFSRDLPSFSSADHLLTLGMVLTTKRSARGENRVDIATLDPLVRSSQLLPNGDHSWDGKVLLTERLRFIALAIEEATGSPTRVAEDGVVDVYIEI